MGGTIYAVTTMVNSTPTGFWVNGRMLEGLPYAAPQQTREVWFDVKYMGHPLIYLCKGWANAARAGQYRSLAPGEAFDMDYELSRCYDLKQLGHYTVVAHYLDGTIDVPRAPKGEKHLVQELTSTVVSFDVNG